MCYAYQCALPLRLMLKVMRLFLFLLLLLLLSRHNKICCALAIAIAAVMVAFPHLQKMTFAMAEFHCLKTKRSEEFPDFSVIFTWIWYKTVPICFTFFLLSRVWGLISLLISSFAWRKFLCS